jgi:hypothetical protein
MPDITQLHISSTDRLAFQLAALTLERATLQQQLLQAQQTNARLAMENAQLRGEITKDDIPQAKQQVEQLERQIKATYGVADLIADIDWSSGVIRRPGPQETLAGQDPGGPAGPQLV